MESSVEPSYFIVYPENAKLVSGEISFRQYSRRKLREFIFAVVLIPVVGAGVLLVFNRIGSNDVCAPYVLIIGFAVLVISKSWGRLNSIRAYRQLEGGQFLDGEIVSSAIYAQSTWQAIDFRRKIYERSTGDGEGLRLSVTYRFQTPEGKSRTGTASALRRDLLWQAQAEYPGMRDVFLKDEDRIHLQEFAPTANTAVKIRYVNDSLFTVM